MKFVIDWDMLHVNRIAYEVSTIDWKSEILTITHELYVGNLKKFIQLQGLDSWKEHENNRQQLLSY